jgi:hypothetical protein
MGVFMSEFFPEPITKLPEADIPLAGYADITFFDEPNRYSTLE